MGCRAFHWTARACFRPASASATAPDVRYTPRHVEGDLLSVPGFGGHGVGTAGAAAVDRTRADILRGECGRDRANNDLLYYHLDVRIDPAAKSIAGRNTIRFRMMKDDTRIQLDLYANLEVDKIVLAARR